MMNTLSLSRRKTSRFSLKEEPNPIASQRLKKLRKFSSLNAIAIVFFACLFAICSSILRLHPTTSSLHNTGPMTSFHPPVRKKGKMCVISIAAMNNFGFILTLYGSVMKSNPDIDCFIWFMGDISEPTNLEAQRGLREIRNVIKGKPGFEMVTMNEIAGKVSDFHPDEIAFKFDLVCVQTTIKPFAFLYTFQEIGADHVIFLDNDIWVTGSFDELHDELSRRSVVVTPHVSNPIPEDGKMQKDINILQAGVFNFGFVAFSNTFTAVKFLRWWGERLNIYGFVDLKNGMHFDQNWGMFIPVFFDHEDYFVIRDLRYNIAYWNLHDTGAGLHMKDGLPHLENPTTLEAEKVVFIHFSGMSLLENYDMQHISRHQTRFTLTDFPRLKDVILAYLSLVSSHDTLRYRSLPYGFANFTDGTKIEPWMRAAYSAAVFPTVGSEYIFDGLPAYEVSMSPFLRLKFQNTVISDPFCASTDCHRDQSKITFFQWLLRTYTSKAVDMDGAFYFSAFEDVIWKSRPDLQNVFPDPTGSDYKGFKEWFLINPVREGILTQSTFKQWEETWVHNVKNHELYHKQVASTEDIGLNIYGWHAGLFSIGISGLKLVRSAKMAGLQVNAIEPLIMPDDHYFMFPSDLDTELTRSCSQPVNLVVMNADSTYVFENEIPRLLRDSKYNIGYWAWELDIFPKDWMQHLAIYDEIWCPSSFIKNSIEHSEAYDGTVVRVLPIPLEVASTHRANTKNTGEIPKSLLSIDRHLRGKIARPFVFLVVFDFNSYEERKNPAASIIAFRTAFPEVSDRDEKYQLIIKTHHGNEDQVNKLKKVAAGDKRIIFINDVLSKEENDALHSYQDCHISLHRSEGYGMNILESLGSGVPVIATNYSGNTDFFKIIPSLDGECIFPVPYKLVELEHSYGPYIKGNHWAEVDHDYVVLAMKTVARMDCKAKHGLQIMRRTFSRFGPEAVGETIKNLLHESLPKILEKQNKNIDLPLKTKLDAAIKDAEAIVQYWTEAAASAEAKAEEAAATAAKAKAAVEKKAGPCKRTDCPLDQRIELVESLKDFRRKEGAATKAKGEAEEKRKAANASSTTLRGLVRKRAAASTTLL